MGKMSEPQWREFVGEGTRTGKVATVRADGRAHVAPVWFVVADDRVVFITETHTVKAKALRRDPRFSLCVDNDALPFSFVVLDAEADLSEEPGQLLDWSTRLAERYMGPEKAEEFGKLYAAPGSLLVRGKITKVIAEVLG